MKYEEVVVGMNIGLREFQITPELQSVCLEALEDNNPLYTDNSRSGTPIAHPVLILTHAVDSEWIGSFPEHLEYKSLVQFIKPASVGKIITAQSKVYDKYIRRGRAFVTVGFDCFDKDGIPVMHCRTTQTIGSFDKYKSSRSREKIDTLKTIRSPEYRNLPKEITLSKMRKFSGHIDGGDNFHTSEKIARSAGFPAPLAQGMMSYAYILEMILKNFGDKWLYGGSLEVKFIRQVYSGDTVTAFGRVSDQERNGPSHRITLEIWCENQRGEHTAIGVATGFI